MQISSDSKISECQNETKLKTFELDRIQLLYEEALKTKKEAGIQYDLLSRKFEVNDSSETGLQHTRTRTRTHAHAHTHMRAHCYAGNCLLAVQYGLVLPKGDMGTRGHGN